MKAAADCNTFKASSPGAKMYFDVEGMTSRGFSDDSWIQMYVRDETIRNDRLTAALEFVSITRIARSSTVIHSLVAETVATSFSGSWTQLIVKRFAQSKLMLIAHLEFRIRGFEFPRHE